jgi:DNA replication licensing factor MCM3
MALFRTRFAAVKKSIYKHRDEAALTEILPPLNEGLPLEEVFSTAEANELFEVLAEQGIVMLEGGVVVRFSFRLSPGAFAHLLCPSQFVV